MEKFNQWLVALLKRVQLLPQVWRETRQRRLRVKVLAAGEVERLDRIRHPEKYRGR